MLERTYAEARDEFARVDAAVSAILQAQRDAEDDVPDRLSDRHWEAMISLLTAPAVRIEDVVEKLRLIETNEIAPVCADEKATIRAALITDLDQVLFSTGAAS
jgi:hypothetical protein